MSGCTPSAPGWTASWWGSRTSSPTCRPPATDSVYLEDLFTAPEARGHGVGRALINAVGDWAAEHGYARVYWHTHETNATARLLYDKVAHAARLHHVHAWTCRRARPPSRTRACGPGTA